MYKTNDFLEPEVIDGFEVTAKRKKIWKIELELLKEFDRVCKKHNINYFVSDGTLLGAIRHKGFIPWDDDLDISMLREDYNKLLTLSIDEFGNNSIFQNYKNDKNYNRVHAQLRRKNTTAILINEINCKLSFDQGIFIDIFPLDYIPDDCRKRKKYLDKVDKLLKILQGYITYNNYSNHSISGRCKKTMFEIIGVQRFLRFFDKYCQKYNNRTKTIGYVSFYGSKSELFNRSKMIEVKDYKFENTIVKGLKNYDYYLKARYGDYMRPIHSPSDHGDVFFDTEKPYTYYLEKGREVLEAYATAKH